VIRRLLVLLLAVPAVVAPSGAATAGTSPAAGLLPFPSDRFTVPDRSSPTGRRVHFAAGELPVTVAGVPIDPAEWNRQDGFSPGTPILVNAPGLAPGDVAPVTDIGRSLAPHSPILLIDTRTGRRTPYWAEFDAHAAANPLLIIRPAVALREATRYLVVVRSPLVHLAWSFTVASERGLTGRVLRMRDDAFARLGHRAPGFTVTRVTDFTPEQDARIARQVRGTVAVPSYLTGAGDAGSRLHYGPDGLPAATGQLLQADFVCDLPRSASAARPAHLSLYGHGLLGSPTEVDAGNVKDMAQTYDFMFCATSWIGLAAADVPYVASVWSDLSRFPSVPDRLQQSFLNFLYLARVMTAPDGFASSPAFRDADGRVLLDRAGGMHYDGNSQGGINGGALTAIAQDWTRSVLGVPAMNYSTLLQRSVDFAPFQQLLDKSYPNKNDQQVIFALLQMLWDRGEANGYAQHLTSDPLPGTPAHQVLMHVAFGDHQVSPAAAQVEARTIGARIHRPALAPGWSDEVAPYWGLRPITRYPYRGSAFVVWNSGLAPAPPPTNLAPAGPQYGTDPHEFPRAQPEAQQQKATFLLTGKVIDVCAGGPCP